MGWNGRVVGEKDMRKWEMMGGWQAGRANDW